MHLVIAQSFISCIEIKQHMMNIFRFTFFAFCLVPLWSQGQDAHPEIKLWANGAPGFESKRNEPEQAQDWWVRNIHNPSITVYLPPKEKATGAAVLICPG